MSDTNIQQLFNSLFSAIDEDLDEFAPLKNFTKNGKIRPSHIFLCVVLLLIFISALTEVLAHLLITLFAMIYPSYMSFKVNPHNNDRPSIKIKMTCVKNG